MDLHMKCLVFLINYKFLKINLRDYSKLQKVLEDYEITHVIHFAAQSHVQNSFTDSLDYTQDNINYIIDKYDLTILDINRLIKLISIISIYD